MNPRYRAFLTTGRNGNAEFMAFVAEAKGFAAGRGGLGVEAEASRYYASPWLKVVDQELFTKACWLYALAYRLLQEAA